MVDQTLCKWDLSVGRLFRFPGSWIIFGVTQSADPSVREYTDHDNTAPPPALSQVGFPANMRLSPTPPPPEYWFRILNQHRANCSFSMGFPSQPNIAPSQKWRWCYIRILSSSAPFYVRQFPMIDIDIYMFLDANWYLQIKATQYQIHV